MNIFRRLFGSANPSLMAKSGSGTEKRNAEIQAAADELWQALRDTLRQYDVWGCACQFPRFHQYISIDCINTGSSFYMSETEGFIALAKPYFEVKELTPSPESYRNEYTCKKCGSVYEYGWSDFSISVSRSYLKITEQKTKYTGAEQLTPIPFYVGLFGHRLPSGEGFIKVGLPALKNYLLERARQ
ncbi:MAG: hypothetical protein ABI687_09540 [Flavitalea sp.]